MSIDPSIALSTMQKFRITMDYIYRGIEIGLPEDIRKNI